MTLFTSIMVTVMVIIIILLIAHIKVKVCYCEEQKEVLISYLFLKYKVDLTHQVSEVESELKKQTSELFDEMMKEESIEKVKTDELKAKTDEAINEQRDKNTSRPSKHKNKRQTSDYPSMSQTNQPSLMDNIRMYYDAFKIGKRIALRFLKRVKVPFLETIVTINVDDPLLNAMLYANAWTVLGMMITFVSQYVYEIRECHYDVKTEFSGNQNNATVECIVMVKLVDIIIVVLLSISDIRKLKQTLR